MNFPRHKWDLNTKPDLLKFLNVAENRRKSPYCNQEEYARLKPLFSLSPELERELCNYNGNQNICIDITHSDEEQECKNPSPKTDKLLSEDNKNVELSPSNWEELAETLKTNLCIKNIPTTLVDSLKNLDSVGLEKAFCFVAKQLSLEDICNLWDFFNNNNIDELIIKSYICHIFLPRIQQEFVYELNEVFNQICEKYSLILKNELNREFINICQLNQKEPKALMQYIAALKNDYKVEILCDFMDSIDLLNSNHIVIFDTLLNPKVNDHTLSRIIGIMAFAATEFCDDNAYGKLLYKVISSFEKHLSEIDQPIKRILGTHRSIWKVKSEKIISSFFNDSLTQSFA